MAKKPYFILFWWLKDIFDTSRLFQMVKYDILKKSQSIAPFWRVDRSDFKLQNTTPGRRLYGKKPYFILFWWLKGIFDTSGLFQMVKYDILKKSKFIAPFWRFDRSDFKL